MKVLLRPGVLVLLGALLLPPCAAVAQQSGRMFRLGWLMLDAPNPVFPDSFLRALQAHGYVEGRNLIVERRWADLDASRVADLAGELVRSEPDVIVALTHQVGVPLRRVTSTVPIVVVGMHDAIAIGLVRSLSRPGGNVTGVEAMAPDIDPKRLQLLKAFAPNLKRLGVLYNPDDPAASLHIHSLRAAGLALGVALELLPIQRLSDFEAALAPARLQAIDGLFIMSDEVTFALFRRIAEAAARARLPTVCEFRLLATLGCLFAYGPTFDEFIQLAAVQVDRILKGAKPAELPVQQVTRIELVVNAKTAAAIGVEVPVHVRLLANDVVQ